MDLKIATPQIVINYGLFLEENNYFEEAFKVRLLALSGRGHVTFLPRRTRELWRCSSGPTSLTSGTPTSPSSSSDTCVHLLPLLHAAVHETCCVLLCMCMCMLLCTCTVHMLVFLCREARSWSELATCLNKPSMAVQPSLQNVRRDTMSLLCVLTTLASPPPQRFTCCMPSWRRSTVCLATPWLSTTEPPAPCCLKTSLRWDPFDNCSTATLVCVCVSVTLSPAIKDSIGKGISRGAEWRKFQLRSTFQ